MKLHFFRSLVFFATLLSFNAFGMKDKFSNEGESEHMMNSVIIPKVDFPKMVRSEKELAELISSHFDRFSSINIIESSYEYDWDKIRHISEKTGITLGVIDKRVGRIVLSYDGGVSFGTGSFVNKQILSNAHVFEKIPKSSKAEFEQGLSLVLPEQFDVDQTIRGLKKYKKAFLDYYVYQSERKNIHNFIPPAIVSSYEYNDVFIATKYFSRRNKKQDTDIGYVKNYATDDDFSSQSFKYKSNYGFHKNEDTVFKLTHYPAGIPIQRTSYGLLDFKARTHKMSTLGGSSGGLIIDYYGKPIGIHSSGTPHYTQGNLTVGDVNIFESLDGLNAEYVTLDRGPGSKLFEMIKSPLVRKPLLKLFTKGKFYI
ncbi:hypothetical protein COB21_00535 [Candidatus Aerophobetes bacterium]|uniref:Serine protease n=1 Tax=Aerophobetes bacterium TaxID=2030807 RepID=A0A2A4X7I4_UNCAE|nr:MAG: hypothetical protein COB21_00535 [Candidatus Aerophobetes bacterium]